MRLTSRSRSMWMVGSGRTALAVTEGTSGDGQDLSHAAWAGAAPVPPRAASNRPSISKATLRTARMASG